MTSWCTSAVLRDPAQPMLLAPSPLPPPPNPCSMGGSLVPRLSKGRGGKESLVHTVCACAKFCTRLARTMTCYDVLVTFDCVLTSALIDFRIDCFCSSPSALSKSTSCVRTGYKEDTKRISDVAFDEFGRVGRHRRIRTNTIFPDFWENLEHAQTVCTRLSFPPTPLIREPGYEAIWEDVVEIECISWQI